jgi:hypothetical protein
MGLGLVKEFQNKALDRITTSFMPCRRTPVSKQAGFARQPQMNQVINLNMKPSRNIACIRKIK